MSWPPAFVRARTSLSAWFYSSRSATTHTDIVLRARKAGLTVRTIPNASVMGAIGATGLQLYSFGQTVSIPFFTESWRPDSFVERIVANRKAGLHTLCLLDIKVKEPDYEALTRGVFNAPPLPPRFMTVGVAAAQLLEAISKRREGGAAEDDDATAAAGAGAARETTMTGDLIDEETLGIGCARLGQPTETIVAAPLKQLCGEVGLGGPLHCLVIPAPELHELELEFLEGFRGAGRSAGS